MTRSQLIHEVAEHIPVCLPIHQHSLEPSRVREPPTRLCAPRYNEAHPVDMGAANEYLNSGGGHGGRTGAMALLDRG